MCRQPDTATHDLQWESNRRPLDLESNALSILPHVVRILKDHDDDNNIPRQGSIGRS